MSQARLVVYGVRIEHRPVAEVARDYGVSRQWVYTLLERYDADGEAGLEPRSRRPHGNSRRIPAAVEDCIVELRKQLTDHGLDAGAHTIAWHLERDGLPVPAASTIWRILTRRGFVTPQSHKRPKASYVRFEADQPNQRWQADVTHWQLANATEVEILNLLDDHSRLAIDSTTQRTITGPEVCTTFQDAFGHHGLPASVLTDNAAVFNGHPRGGPNRFQKLLAALQIDERHSRAYHPQTCGKVERFHQTLKKWLAAHDPASTLAELQTQLDTFVDLYNHDRPHRAIGRRTPSEVYQARPKATPTGTLTDLDHRIRHDVIDKSGTVTLRHNSRLHHIGIGKTHRGTHVLMLVAGTDIRIVATDTGELLRHLTLDPTRDYQPQGTTPDPEMQ